MKRLLIITAIAGIMALTSNQSNAQVSINVNIGTPSTWLPSGYQNVNYYYLPDVQAYYYVPQRQFVYMHNNVWIRSSYLPERYRNYNLAHGRKVVFRGNTPFGYNNVRYVSYRNSYNGNHNYRPERFDNRRGYDKHDFKDKGWKHDNGRGHDKGNGHDNGRGNGHGRGGRG